MDEPLLGMVGQITVPVDADRPGEIVLFVRGGSEAFTAYSEGRQPIPKGTRCMVRDQSSPRSVVVAPCDW
ncbi:MAG: hypothetical protein ACRDZQ_02205 [Acidimicrobiales bacterium]